MKLEGKSLENHLNILSKKMTELNKWATAYNYLGTQIILVSEFSRYTHRQQADL